MPIVTYAGRYRTDHGIPPVPLIYVKNGSVSTSNQSLGVVTSGYDAEEVNAANNESICNLVTWCSSYMRRLVDTIQKILMV